MPRIRVDFYLLNKTEDDERNVVVCRLLEKAYLKGHQVYVHCSNQKHAHQIDERLWNYKDESFVPHNLVGEGPNPPPPIQIGYQAVPRGFNDIVFNLTDEIPDFVHRFSRIIEVVSANEDDKILSREHYRTYRELGYELNCTQVES